MNTLNTDALWMKAEQEADSAELRNAGLWARCFAQSGGDPAKAKAMYMTERMQQLGASPEQKADKSLGWGAWLGLTLLVLVVGFFALAALQPDDGSAGKRAAIDLCWKDHKNPALDPATLRFVANTCEMMEREYKQQYGSAP